MPPVIKVYEALGAIGDGRVVVETATLTSVTSSEGDKVYTVETSPDLRTISANDNASFWQGYLGYPGIAVLLVRGFFRLDKAASTALSSIPWKELNRRFKNDYSKTLAEIDSRLETAGVSSSDIRREAKAILEALREFSPIQGVRRRPPRASR